jgi:hypothetical protein
MFRRRCHPIKPVSVTSLSSSRERRRSASLIQRSRFFFFLFSRGAKIGVVVVPAANGVPVDRELGCGGFPRMKGHGNTHIPLATILQRPVDRELGCGGFTDERAWQYPYHPSYYTKNTFASDRQSYEPPCRPVTFIKIQFDACRCEAKVASSNHIFGSCHYIFGSCYHILGIKQSKKKRYSNAFRRVTDKSGLPTLTQSKQTKTPFQTSTDRHPRPKNKDMMRLLDPESGLQTPPPLTH